MALNFTVVVLVVVVAVLVVVIVTVVLVCFVVALFIFLNPLVYPNLSLSINSFASRNPVAIPIELNTIFNRRSTSDSLI